MGLFLQFWCCCLCDAFASGVVASILVVLFVQHPCEWGCYCNWGGVVHAMLRQFWSLFDFGVVLSAPLLLFPFFNFGVVDCAMFLLFWSLFLFWCCIFWMLLLLWWFEFGVAFFVSSCCFFVFQFWCCCSWYSYLIPELVVVSILVLYSGRLLMFWSLFMKQHRCYSQCFNFGDTCCR